MISIHFSRFHTPRYQEMLLHFPVFSLSCIPFLLFFYPVAELVPGMIEQGGDIDQISHYLAGNFTIIQQG